VSDESAAASERRQVWLRVNGDDHLVQVEDRRTLADTLRHDLGLTGTHLGCEHGVCGACTVLIDGEPARSCLVFAVQADGCDVATVEGLAVEGKLSTVQEAFSDHHALQCGFCTSGLLMLATAFLRDEPAPSDDDIVEVVASNLCRCTGYEPIVAAIRALAADPSPQGAR
jgi:aerobic-type carbon monoxide dehydrogenase small subunit (CoxS/CutS family)